MTISSPDADHAATARGFTIGWLSSAHPRGACGQVGSWLGSDRGGHDLQPVDDPRSRPVEITRAVDSNDPACGPHRALAKPATAYHPSRHRQARFTALPARPTAHPL